MRMPTYDIVLGFCKKKESCQFSPNQLVIFLHFWDFSWETKKMQESWKLIGLQNSKDISGFSDI
jgi:hypothetical protein